MMPVSKKMKQAPLALAGIAQGELYYFDEEQLNKAVQEAVNKAWTDFDPEDESTWPEKNKILWLEWCWTGDDTPLINRNMFNGRRWTNLPIAPDMGKGSAIPIRYADPQDLKFEGDE